MACSSATKDVSPYKMTAELCPKEVKTGGSSSLTISLFNKRYTQVQKWRFKATIVGESGYVSPDKITKDISSRGTGKFNFTVNTTKFLGALSKGTYTVRVTGYYYDGTAFKKYLERDVYLKVTVPCTDSDFETGKVITYTCGGAHNSDTICRFERENNKKEGSASLKVYYYNLLSKRYVGAKPSDRSYRTQIMDWRSGKVFERRKTTGCTPEGWWWAIYKANFDEGVEKGNVYVVSGTLGFWPRNPSPGQEVRWGAKVKNERTTSVTARVALQKGGTEVAVVDVSLSPGVTGSFMSSGRANISAPSSDTKYCAKVMGVVGG